MLNHESGFKGLFGSGDLREVVRAREGGDPHAILAFDVYMHRLVREAGAMVATLGGLDALVFTAGIGENSALVRGELCRRLAFLGVLLSEEKNTDVSGDAAIHSEKSKVQVLVIRAREEWEIVRACAALIS
jgi:acetate kinase